MNFWFGEGPMRKMTLWLSATWVVLLGAWAHADAPKEPGAKAVAGNWLGPIKVGAIELRQAAKFEVQPDGTLKGTINSLDQDAKDYPLDVVEWTDGTLRLELKISMFTYEGKLNKEGTEIAGVLKQRGVELPLTFKKVDQLPSARRPQDPKKPYPYVAEEVIYENKAANIKLAGTLTLPRTAGPKSPSAAVILISGSGAQDRDESIFNHRPFLVIADYLTRRGVAVLRVDDRGVGGSTGSVRDATSEDFVGDVLAGVAYLKTRPEIDAKRIGLIGHSEGGIIAPMAATRSDDIAFIVLLAGTGLPGEEVLYLQGTALQKLLGVPEKQIERQRALQKQVFAVLKQEKDPEVIAKKSRAVIDAFIATLSDEEKKEIAAAKSLIENQIKALQSPWLRSFLFYDPRPTLQKVCCPVLALIGEKDFQVPPKENLPEIEKALKAGGNRDFTVKELPKLNHLFQTSETGSISEYGKIEETFAPSALELIGDWIVERVKREVK